MLEWILRGLRKGVVTTRYPARPFELEDGFRAAVVVRPAAAARPELESVCPTGAIAVDAAGEVSLDRGRCILCGACVAADPERFAFDADHEVAARSRADLVVRAGERPAAAHGGGLARRARALRRSTHVRHVDAGSDGAEEWEIQALANPFYDLQRLGFFLTASPRHADILLVTGGVTAPMRLPLERAYEAMPEPRAVVAAGSDACSGGLAGAAGEVAGGVDQVLPVDVYVPGSPPHPISLLHGLLLARGDLEERRR